VRHKRGRGPHAGGGRSARGRAKALGDVCRIAIHAHNDSGCGVANSLVAVASGADMVQGTINGYGERCGNADLCAIIPGLKLKMDVTVCLNATWPSSRTPRALWPSCVTSSRMPHQPLRGPQRFCPQRGGCTWRPWSAIRPPRAHRPALVGNEPHVLVSELSGRATITQRARDLGYSLSEEKELAER